MVENTLYDKKSLRTVVGKTADFDELAKDCVAFANAQGGIIEIGIENNEKLPPVGQTFDEKLPVNIVNKLAGLTNNITMQADEETKSNGGKVIVLHIYRSIAIAMTSKGKIYIRIGDSSVPVTSSEDILRLAADKNSYSWEDAVTQFDWHKADPEKLENFLSQIRDSDRVSDFVKSKDTKELLDFFGMTDAESDKMTNLGVLFIGQQTQRGRLSNAPVIQCIKYDEYGEKVNKWLWDDYRMNPKEMIDSIWETVPEWKESYEVPDGMRRKNIPAYDESVIREILCNALVHRPYTTRGDVFINIHPDRVEVVNPGQLPLGVTPENILHKTLKRNEHLTNLCFVLHMMEREGSGYDKMYEQQLLFGKSVPKVIEGDDFVKAIVERRIKDMDAYKVMQDVKKRFELKQKATICLGLIAQFGPISGSQLVKMLELSGSDALRAWIRPLQENGLIESSEDNTKGKLYFISSDIQSVVAKKTSKQTKSDAIQQAIINDFIKHRASSLTEVADRLKGVASYHTIRKYINKLEEDGQIITSGKGRWMKYVWSGPESIL